MARKENPALLTNADDYGTLAAARSLGRYGVAVTVAHENQLGAAMAFENKVRAQPKVSRSGRPTPSRPSLIR